MTSQLLRDHRVAPSILASDFARLGEQVAEVMDAGARVIRRDITSLDQVEDGLENRTENPS